MITSPSDNTQPFSWAWVIASVLIITAMELCIAIVISPALLASRLASTMVQLRLDMLMHLGSFLLGGWFVGIISPRVRLWEPAVGAAIAVIIVFLMTFFLPHSYLRWDWTKIFVGGGIGFGLALVGAYTAEKWMGNIEVDDPESRRARLRRDLWGSQGMLSRGDGRFLSTNTSSELDRIS
ncbi:MAG: hypothetical protein A2138_03085 [Deltaproteobacteria bacterium RBG_16_71_12]|nr:MAG: hypothetical protein A2138_03085 [Deltaproteobacteria bacterium RBG_16_71_12]